MHVAGDLLGSVAAIPASLVIIFTGWTPIDPILSVVVVLPILKSAWSIVKESGHIFLEAAPSGLDRRDVVEVLLGQVEGLAGVDHIHAWSLTQERPMMTLEISVKTGKDANAVKDSVKTVLRSHFRIEHSTVEIV